ncbi:hypothetical protein sscle_03g026260 [Sclerotinia sclerotiorum 1980 UF-70]|uniref:Uncharacterized protein n=1 Tax=Sclerotinia sclerotiorum (strain ATCC 18683 / 1980 / Ss-1) TaxID=665079 RepID=A0A1D9PYY0_SCLS1|nr:hypothetical protein sscle_03g026260 [Sclerotinia sclerotiorum 1980 UF-70]
MNSTGTALAVGDVKFSRQDDVSDGESRNEIGGILRLADIGQLLWYACRRKTRFAWCISNTELMVIQFTCSRTTRIPVDTGDNDIVGILEEVVTSAMLEREGSVGSSQRRGGSGGAPPDLPLSQRSRLSPTSVQDNRPKDESVVLTATNTHRRTNSNTSADSETVSPTNRHLQKKARETFTSDMRESSSPSLPSSPTSHLRRVTPSSPSQITVEDTSVTPEKRGTLSPSYEPPSSPYTANGGLSASKIREISDVAGGFTARVSTLQLGEDNDREAPLALLGLIALASSLRMLNLTYIGELG